MAIDIKAELASIAEELRGTEVLTAAEREKVATWSVNLGVAAAAGDKAQVENYATALNGMLGVAELRAVKAGEAALLRVAGAALRVIVAAVV